MVKIKMKFIKKKQVLFMEEIVHKVYKILTTIKFKKNKILITIIQFQKNKIIKYSLITKKKENRSQKKKTRRSKKKKQMKILSNLLIKISPKRKLTAKQMKVILIIQVLNQNNQKKVKIHSQRVKLMNKVHKISAKRMKRFKIFQKQVFQRNLHKILNKFPQINHKSSQGMKIIIQYIQ